MCTARDLVRKPSSLRRSPGSTRLSERTGPWWRRCHRARAAAHLRCCAKAALVTGADEMYVRLAGMRCPDQRLRGLIMLGRRGPPSGTSDPVTEPGADEWAASFGRLGTASSPPSALEGRFCCLACGTAERTLLSFCALCSASASNARSCCSDDGSSDWRQARALNSAIDSVDD